MISCMPGNLGSYLCNNVKRSAFNLTPRKAGKYQSNVNSVCIVEARYVTKDVRWNHTSSVGSRRYVRWPAPGCGAAAGSWDLRFVFCFFYWLGGTAAGGNQIRGGEVSEVGPTAAASRRGSCLPKHIPIKHPTNVENWGGGVVCNCGSIAS